jgi:hypothetical protein
MGTCALIALGRPKSVPQPEFAAFSYSEAMEEMKNGLERKANLESIRSAVSRATHLLGLILDPPRLAWDGLTLYRLQTRAPIFHARDFIIRIGPCACKGGATWIERVFSCSHLAQHRIAAYCKTCGYTTSFKFPARSGARQGRHHTQWPRPDESPS